MSLTTSQPVTKPKTSILDLSNELLDRILQHILVFDRAIELSPIPKDGLHPCAILGPYQYDYALRYQNVVRPVLGILRINERFNAVGRRIYYQQNAFSFSSPAGWLVIARFFGLIGATNTSMLRDITIIHPTLSQANQIYTESCLKAFYVDQLSPFGLADLAGYDETYIATNKGPKSALGLRPVLDPVLTLRQISGLRRLNLLYYRDYSDPPFVGPDDTFDPAIQQHPINTLPSPQQDRLSVSVTHLFSHDPGFASNPRTMKLAAIHRGELDDPLWEPTHLAAVRTAASHFESLNWTMGDERVCRGRSAWPIAMEARALGLEEVIHGDAAHIEWDRRQTFETTFRIERGDRWWEPDESSKTCVVCWLPSATVHGVPSERSCQCPEGPKRVPPGWIANGVLLANPGVPITVDTGKFEGENVSWNKSHVVRYIEQGYREGWKKVFGFGKADSATRDWAQNEAVKDHMVDEGIIAGAPQGWWPW